MPETPKAGTQTLDRLALALTGGSALTNLAGASAAAHLQSGGTNHLASSKTISVTNASPVRPILDDLEGEESYWEARQTGTKAGELAFAIRLSEARTALWRNLTAALGASTAAATTGGFAGQWQFTTSPGRMADGSLAPRTLELSRAGDWTVLGLAAQSNGLVREFEEHIQRDHTPFAASITNFWLTAEINVPAFSRCASPWASVHTGRSARDFSGARWRRRGHAHSRPVGFSKPLPATTGEPWNIPTNLIHEPLLSFTAIRGIGPWLSSQPVWTNLAVGPAPNQLYFWAQGGLPFISYCAAPFPNATNVLEGLSADLLKANPWIATNGLGTFERSTNFYG